MPSTRSLTITLPATLAEQVETKVASGEYVSASEVVRDGLSSLFQNESAVEDWLRNHVAPTYDALMSDPGRSLSADQVIGRLEERARSARDTSEREP